MRSAKGLSLLQVVVSIGIASLLIAAMSMLVGRGFTISREQVEQARISGEALNEMGRLTAAIENARNVNGEWWFVSGGPYIMTMYSNVDGDADPEKVTYGAEGPEFVRIVTEMIPDGIGGFIEDTTATQTLTKFVRNGENSRAIFSYKYDNFNRVVAVGVNLQIDVVTGKYPDAAEVEVGQISPRGPLLQTLSQGESSSRVAGSVAGVGPFGQGFDTAPLSPGSSYCPYSNTYNYLTDFCSVPEGGGGSYGCLYALTDEGKLWQYAPNTASSPIEIENSDVSDMGVPPGATKGVELKDYNGDLFVFTGEGASRNVWKLTGVNDYELVSGTGDAFAGNSFTRAQISSSGGLVVGTSGALPGEGTLSFYQGGDVWSQALGPIEECVVGDGVDPEYPFEIIPGGGSSHLWAAVNYAACSGAFRYNSGSWSKLDWLIQPPSMDFLTAISAHADGFVHLGSHEGNAWKSSSSVLGQTAGGAEIPIPMRANDMYSYAYDQRMYAAVDGGKVSRFDGSPPWRVDGDLTGQGATKATQLEMWGGLVVGTHGANKVFVKKFNDNSYIEIGGASADLGSGINALEVSTCAGQIPGGGLALSEFTFDWEYIPPPGPGDAESGNGVDLAIQIEVDGAFGTGQYDGVHVGMSYSGDAISDPTAGGPAQEIVTVDLQDENYVGVPIEVVARAQWDTTVGPKVDGEFDFTVSSEGTTASFGGAGYRCDVDVTGNNVDLNWVDLGTLTYNQGTDNMTFVPFDPPGAAPPPCTCTFGDCPS